MEYAQSLADYALSCAKLVGIMTNYNSDGTSYLHLTVDTESPSWLGDAQPENGRTHPRAAAAGQEAEASLAIQPCYGVDRPNKAIPLLSAREGKS